MARQSFQQRQGLQSLQQQQANHNAQLQKATNQAMAQLSNSGSLSKNPQAVSFYQTYVDPFSSGSNIVIPNISGGNSTGKSKPRHKFKVGDLAEVKAGDHLDRSDVGKIGTVVEVDRDHLGTYSRLKFEDGHTASYYDKDLKKVTIKPKAKVTFDSVILEDDKKIAIIDAMNQLDHHDTIFEKWGFGEVFEKGTAISLLFWGPPGTGKTLMAQAIADKIGRELLVIGTAEIESSEPGGAERNIKAFFENGKDKVLLFDECDSLVYSRENVGSILAAQVNQLLASLEKFEGVVVFTTNRLGTLDEAFNRRLSLKVEFSTPTAKQRVDIWKRMFPKKAPLAKDINWDRLASVEVTGGYIKNVVLRAARQTASQKLAEITEAVLVSALKEEVKAMMEFEAARTSIPRVVGYGPKTDLTVTKG